MFKLIKEIKSKDGVLHFRRWRVLTTPWFVINWHGIYHEDEDRDLHNHPWTFINIILWGSYWELRSKKLGETHNAICKRRSFLNIAYRDKNSFHKIFSMGSKAVYSLNIMWNKTDEWGYDVNGRLIEHKMYRELKRKNEI